MVNYLIAISLLIQGCASIYMAIKAFRQGLMHKKMRRQNESLIKRNEEVYEFRMKILHCWPNLIDRLPEYKEMLYSDKDIKLLSFFEEKDLYTMN